MFKKALLFISLGSINLLHAGLHLFQFLQSLILISGAVDFGHDSFLHHPLFNFIWGIIGLATFYIGIKDFIHHRQHAKISEKLKMEKNESARNNSRLHDSKSTKNI